MRRHHFALGVVAGALGLVATFLGAVKVTGMAIDRAVRIRRVA